ncbi:MAG: HAD hydrolase-like protein [Cyclobacteriaceae bacterium]|nr:HAD hydrolase-like protein [Cyclobacteriaceae bacterium]
MKIELVVFDLAGTTVKDNQDVHRVLQRALALFDVEISVHDANAVMGIPKPVAIRELLQKRYFGDRPITDGWISEIHKAFVSEMIAFYENDQGVGEKEGVTETFRSLKRAGIKVVVDTGFDRQIVDPLLTRLGWVKNNLIDGSVTSDEVLRGRPFPDLIFKAMEITGVTDPLRVAKVGDTVSDLEEGTAAGCALVIGVTTGAFSREELHESKHTHLIGQLSEVLEILKIEPIIL